MFLLPIALGIGILLTMSSTRAKDKQDVQMTMRGAHCWTDPQEHKSNYPKTAQELLLNLDNKLNDLQLNLDFIEENWTPFRNAVHSAALEILGPAYEAPPRLVRRERQ